MLCPWADSGDFAYSGTNKASPLRHDIPRAVKDADGLTPEEQNWRRTERQRDVREKYTAEELAEAQEKRHSYHRRVALPIRKFKKQAKRYGMSKSQIDEAVKTLKDTERLAFKAGLVTDPGTFLDIVL